MSLDMLQLRSLCDDMEQKEGDSQSQAELLKHAVNADHIHKDGKPWGKEEIELLRKGIAKYPKGTSRRWEVIFKYIGMGRSVEEILKATKTVLLQKPDSAKAFESFLEKRKPAVSISSPLSTREEVVGVSSTSTSKSTPTRPDVTQPKPSQDVDKVEPVGSSSDQDVWSSVQETALVALSTCSIYMQ
ncbi:putative transcription factor MYB-related family [Helianthus annuus]|nr:putative transcription factor MYB-related family [Helianthus annuus]